MHQLYSKSRRAFAIRLTCRSLPLRFFDRLRPGTAPGALVYRSFPDAWTRRSVARNLPACVRRRHKLLPGTRFRLLARCSARLGLCGWITNRRRTSLTQVVGVAAGIIAIHAAGCAYLICSYLYFYVFEGSKAYLEWQPWIFQYLRNLSWYALPYDAVFALAAVGVAFPFRWLVNTLTITDAGPPPKKVKYDRRALEELARN